MLLKKLASSFSLALVAALGLGQDYGAVYEKLEAAPEPQRERVLRDLLSDPQVKGDLKVKARTSLQMPSDEDLYWDVVDRAEMYALSQSADVNRAQVRERITKIKSSPLYRRSEKEQSNWLAKAMQSLSEWFSRLRMPQFRPPQINAPSADLRWVTVIAWIVLGGLATLLTVLVVRAFRYSRAAKRKRSALLDEAEPDRTVDEWLALAHQLTAEGRLREAIRCYYVATLLRLDEAGIAAFRREETNWEHLARIAHSGRLPEEVGFRHATQQFDSIWYGHLPHGVDDVATFEELYRRAAALKEAAP